MSFKATNRPQEERYRVVEDLSGGWQVIDALTRLPAASNGRDFVQLTREDALDFAGEFNSCERQGRKSPLL